MYLRHEQYARYNLSLFLQVQPCAVCAAVHTLSFPNILICSHVAPKSRQEKLCIEKKKKIAISLTSYFVKTTSNISAPPSKNAASANKKTKT